MPDLSDMGELFARDPLKLTKEDRSQIIQWYRDNRQAFMLGQKLTKAGAVKTPKKGASDGIPGLSLDELDL